MRGIALLLVIAKAVKGIMLRFVQVGLGGGLVTFLMFGVGNSIMLKFLIYFVYGVGCIHGAVYGGQRTTSSQERVCLESNTGCQAQQQAPLPTGLFDQPLK